MFEIQPRQVRTADHDGTVLHLFERELARGGADYRIYKMRQAFGDHQ